MHEAGFVRLCHVVLALKVTLRLRLREMLPIATSNKGCGGKEQGFGQENTTSIEAV